MPDKPQRTFKDETKLKEDFKNALEKLK